jgi:hypothetical protein
MKDRFGQALVITLVAAGLIAGCRSEGRKREKARSAKGTVTRIDLPGNRVSMKVVVERTGKEMEVDGSITPDTEVWINGAKKQPSDVEVGDEIRVAYVRTGDETAQQFIVQRVEVSRPEGWKSTRPPAPTTAVARGRKGLIRDVDPPGTIEVPLLSSSTQRALSKVVNAQDPARAEAITGEIYAEIRRRMDAAVAERIEMLKAGKPVDDPQIRQREEVIRRARKLLMERGENLEPVDPPLPEDLPTTRPAA